jgi:peptidoglycan L-alanyl-D-glutamate endopeptidase CwlK
MPSFSQTSKRRLATCHPDLQKLFNKVIEHRDCTIICGYRTEGEQDEAYRTGHSQLKFPESMHNFNPSAAVDVMPYFDSEPHIRWNDVESTYNFIGYVQGIADELGIKIRSGSDWDIDLDFHDQSFMDLPHFELVLEI